jgi:hypothetical protein
MSELTVTWSLIFYPVYLRTFTGSSTIGVHFFVHQS